MSVLVLHLHKRTALRWSCIDMISADMDIGRNIGMKFLIKMNDNFVENQQIFDLVQCAHENERDAGKNELSENIWGCVNAG